MTLDIVKKEGVVGLYRGMSASYLGVTEGVIQWVLYEVGRRIPLSCEVDESISERKGSRTHLSIHCAGAP